LKDLSNEDLVALFELLATEIWKTQKKTICNFRQVGMGPTTQTKQSPPTTCESMDD
jgi:hypothetical protein